MPWPQQKRAIMALKRLVIVGEYALVTQGLITTVLRSHNDIYIGCRNTTWELPEQMS
jgi:hypothetical protein